jgi:predicted nucleic acid-binding Zn ribbon protein
VKPDRIGGEVRRELARFGPAEGMTDIVRAWPDAVGDQIARNAWPARLAKDGTLHVATASSTWAFELSQLEPKLLEHLRAALADAAPPRLRFAPGKLPEPSAEELKTHGRAVREPTGEERELASALAAGIEDESLRKIVAKAALASLSRGS